MYGCLFIRFVWVYVCGLLCWVVFCCLFVMSLLFWVEVLGVVWVDGLIGLCICVLVIACVGCWCLFGLVLFCGLVCWFVVCGCLFLVLLCDYYMMFGVCLGLVDICWLLFGVCFFDCCCFVIGYLLMVLCLVVGVEVKGTWWVCWFLLIDLLLFGLVGFLFVCFLGFYLLVFGGGCCVCFVVVVLIG